VLSLVVVLYRSPLRRLRGLLAQVEEVDLGVTLAMTVVINQDGVRAARRRRRIVIGSRPVTIDIVRHDNKSGVAGAYRFALAEAASDDIIVLLDADTKLDGRFFESVVANMDTLRSGTVFLVPDQYSAGIRVSPYRLQGLVPKPVMWRLQSEMLRFEDGWGVINSGLAGTVESFRRVDGFDDRIGLDLSDVRWSLAAARNGARLLVTDCRYEHSLSMLSGTFGWRRLRKYLVACCRLGVVKRDITGALRLMVRGLRAYARSRS